MQDIPQLPEFIPPPKTFEEMAERPGFQSKLDDKLHKIERILTRYYFAKQAPCGRSGCRRMHNDGFLVRTEDELETNIGNTCGFNFLGGEQAWDEQVRNYDRRLKRHAQLTRANELKANYPAIKRQVAELYNLQYGFKWQKQAIATLIRVLGSDLFQILQSAEKRRDYEVVTTVERTHEEIEQLHKDTGTPKEHLRYVKTKEVSLQPMPWITYDPNAELYLGLLHPLANFAEIDYEQLNPTKLTRALKKVENWENKIKVAKDVCESAPKFFHPVNLASIAKRIPDYKKDKRARFEEWCRSVDCRDLAAGLDDEPDGRVAPQA